MKRLRALVAIGSVVALAAMAVSATGLAAAPVRAAGDHTISIEVYNCPASVTTLAQATAPGSPCGYIISNVPGPAQPFSPPSGYTQQPPYGGDFAFNFSIVAGNQTLTIADDQNPGNGGTCDTVTKVCTFHWFYTFAVPAGPVSITETGVPAGHHVGVAQAFAVAQTNTPIASTVSGSTISVTVPQTPSTALVRIYNFVNAPAPTASPTTRPTVHPTARPTTTPPPTSSSDGNAGDGSTGPLAALILLFGAGVATLAGLRMQAARR